MGSAMPIPEELVLQRFAAGDSPPQPPACSSVTLEPTTFHTSCKEPAEFGNNLIDFLAMASGAVIKKVNRDKFTIKAKVQADDGTCTMKIRIYDQGEKTLAVEFQRREGESRALHKVFDQVSDHFATAPTPKCTPADQNDGE